VRAEFFWAQCQKCFSGHSGKRGTLERRWFAPLLAALRAQRIGMITVRVPDAVPGAGFETVRGDLRRFWRRPRPIGKCAGRTA